MCKRKSSLKKSGLECRLLRAAVSCCVCVLASVTMNRIETIGPATAFNRFRWCLYILLSHVRTFTERCGRGSLRYLLNGTIRGSSCFSCLKGIHKYNNNNNNYTVRCIVLFYLSYNEAYQLLARIRNNNIIATK